MKNALVRLLAFATLATSLSAFATAGEAKHKDSATAGNQQNGCPTTQEDRKQKKEKKTKQDESQQEKDFDRLLMGTFG